MQLNIGPWHIEEILFIRYINPHVMENYIVAYIKSSPKVNNGLHYI